MPLCFIDPLKWEMRTNILTFEWIHILYHFSQIDERIRHRDEANGLRHPRITEVEQPEIFLSNWAKAKLIRQFAVTCIRSVSNLIQIRSLNLLLRILWLLYTLNVCVIKAQRQPGLSISISTFNLNFDLFTSNLYLKWVSFQCKERSGCIICWFTSSLIATYGQLTEQSTGNEYRHCELLEPFVSFMNDNRVFSK